MIRNDPGGDSGEGVGGGGTGGGPLDQFLNGRAGMITPVYDQYGNLVGYRQGFPNDGRGSQGGANSNGGGAAVPTGTTAATAGAAGGAAGAGAVGTGVGLLGIAKTFADLLSNVSRNNANDRINAGSANANQARAEADIFRTRMDASLKGPRQSAQDAAYGDTLANIQPFSWLGSTHMVGNIPVPESSGGMGPQNFGPATREAGQKLATLGAGRVNSPSFDLPTPPVLPPLPQAGTGDSILNGAATGASLFALYNEWLRNHPSSQQVGTTRRIGDTTDDPNFTNGIG